MQQLRYTKDYAMCFGKPEEYLRVPDHDSSVTTGKKNQL